MKKHTLIHLMLLAILLLCMASCITFVGCNTSYNVTVHAGEYYGDLVWNASEESFETFMASFPKIDGKRAVYFFDEDYKVRADVAALTAEKLKREDCKDVYIKWAICEHTSAQNQSNGVDPTCSTEGKKPDYLCPTCGHIEVGESIPCLPHTYESFVENPATCTEPGTIAHKECEICHYLTDINEEEKLSVSDVIIPMIDHKQSDWIIDRQATCVSDGSKHTQCTVCRAQLSTEVLPALGHDITHNEAKEATCTEAGWHAFDTCSRCDYTTKVDDIAAKGHKIVKVNAQAATCTEVGWDAYETCSRCDYSTYKEILALGHKEGDWIIDVHPTCLKNGSKHKECTRCHDTLETQSIDPLGHDDGTWVTDVAPTCTNVGSEDKKCTRCQHILETREIVALGHDTIDHEAKEATCTEKGWDAYQTCSRCDYTTYKEIEALGHDFVDCVCSRCSEERHIQDGKFCRHDNYIYFGTYPQSEVTDTGLTSILTAQAGSLPTENNSANWTSYGYYISSTVTDFMWYIDLTYSGEQYRGVYFTSYRPNSTDISSSASYSYQDDNGYTLSTPYWFKYEPIKWRVLSESNGEAMILCEMIIDSQEYSTGTGSSPDPNNYAYSNIRSFLNNTFYNTAFASLQKEIILLTEVDNSARSTNPDIDAEYWLDGKNYSTCANTNDYIFLLSEQEVTIAAYGFNTDCTSNDSARRKHPTAYAQCQGAYTSTVGYLGNDSWWLRSPSDYDIAINTVYYVSTYGTADDYRGNACYNTACGVVPALNIKLTDCKENGHSIGSNCICTKCGDTVHTSTESLKCSVCGDATTYYRSGDYIYFGTYPQNEVTNSTLKSTLTSKAGTLPTASNSANWTSYGYYISSTVTDFMWYIDLTYSGEQYRGVYFTSYRPYYTKNSGTAGNSWQDDNGYYTSTVYWFKYDPIKWRILNESNGEALILCEMIIDSREYDSSTGSRTISGNTVYPNNYEYSNIRTFLNNTFYNTAFSSLQKELILLTTVDNSARSSNPDNDSTKWSSGTNKYACSNTKDYIFLLSEQEVTTSAYGFSTSVSSSDTRNKQTTAYAECQGAWTSTSSSTEGNGWWWLRSPYYSYIYARVVDYDGYAGNLSTVNDSHIGVVPALKIKLN